MAKRRAKEWHDVKGMTGWSIIGDRERFSLCFEPFEGMQLKIHGCRVAEYKGEEFISYPSWKDKDDKYHPYAYVTFEDDEIEKIIAALE